MNWRVPLADLNFDAEEELDVFEVLRSRWLSMGEVTKQFEQEFSDFMGVKHSIAVNNATAALHSAGVAIGLGVGDEVILPSFTFVATANAVRYTGATPVFADIEIKRREFLITKIMQHFCNFAVFITFNTGADIVIHHRQMMQHQLL